MEKTQRIYQFKDGDKFGFHRKLANDITRWVCTKKGCCASIKTDLGNNVIEERLYHKHKNAFPKYNNITSNSGSRSMENSLKARQTSETIKHWDRKITLPEQDGANKPISFSAVDRPSYEKCKTFPSERQSSPMEYNDNSSTLNDYDKSTSDSSSSEAHEYLGLERQNTLDIFNNKFTEEHLVNKENHEDNNELYLTDPNELVEHLYTLSIDCKRLKQEIEKIVNELRRRNYIY